MHSRRARRAPSAAVIVVCAVVTAAVVVLVAYLAPRVIPNLTTSVAETDLVQSISHGGVTATVTVPAGWSYQRPWGADELVLRTPDGRFTATLTVTPLPPADAVAVRADDASGPIALERLGSGLDAAHAENGDLIVAAVGAAAAPSVQVVSHGPSGDVAAYRPALAALLESVRVAQ